MGKIVSHLFVSLDGVVESPDQWHMSYLDDEMGAAIGRGRTRNKAFLMGRKLYEEWAAAPILAQNRDLRAQQRGVTRVRRRRPRDHVPEVTGLDGEISAR